MRKANCALSDRPESHEDIASLVRRLLSAADAFDVLPTPIDRLFEIARITHVAELPDPDENFLRSLSNRARNAFLSGKQKIRGIADMRRRVAYVPRWDTAPRVLFAKGHELGHVSMVWHNIKLGYQDDNCTLSPRVKDLFEQEANHFSAETIFQGPSFRRRARDYVVGFQSIFQLAADHGASKQATTWRFVEEQDVATAALQYYPSNSQFDDSGNAALTLWKITPSPKFKEQFGDIDPPGTIRSDHQWVSARDCGKVASGDIAINCGLSGAISFEWEAWWNHHALIVLLHRKPIVRVVSSLFTKRL